MRCSNRTGADNTTEARFNLDGVNLAEASHNIKGVSAQRANEQNLKCKYGHLGSWTSFKTGGSNTRRCVECARHRNRKARTAGHFDFYVKQKAATAKSLRSDLCPSCHLRPPIPEKRCCPVCTERRKGINKRFNERAKTIIFNYYGKSCICCGETEPLFLTLDHINNDGRQDRPKDGSTSIWYKKIATLIRTGKPRKDLRVMCYNCNCGRARNRGICPHQVVKDARA